MDRTSGALALIRLAVVSSALVLLATVAPTAPVIPALTASVYPQEPAARDEPPGTFSILGSSAMLIVTKDGGVWLHNDVVVRLQVDDNPEPLVEMRRLVEMNARRFRPR